MARGRKTPNPVSKLINLNNQLALTIESLVQSSAEPDFQEQVQTIKADLEKREKKENALNREAKEISRILSRYPGLSKEVLFDVKTKVSNYKRLDILDNFRKIEKSETKNQEPKKASSISTEEIEQEETLSTVV